MRSVQSTIEIRLSGVSGAEKGLKMKTGGKRKSVKTSIVNSEELSADMSPQRKRSRLENNNVYKHNQEDTSLKHLVEMGVGVLPNSDCEEDGTSDLEPINQIPSDKSDESSRDSIVHKSPRKYKTAVKQSEAMTTPPQQLLSYKSLHNIKDPFASLSDEIMLMVLQWVPRTSLANCALVCQRWRRIVYDESLWQRIDLTGIVLHTDQMGYMLQRNPLILRMAQAEVSHPMLEELTPAMEDFICQIQYLDLSMALIQPEDLAQLLGKCQSLRKLSLEHCITDGAVCSSIAANTELEVLNMSQCYQINAAGLEEILINCGELTELNLAWTRLDSECIDIVCKLVNGGIKKLNLSGCLKNMKDNHSVMLVDVKELVSRCTCLKELDLSDCTELTCKCLEPIIQNLCDIKELSFSRCYNILPPNYIKLANMSSLKYLNVIGVMQQKQLDTFKTRFKTTELNEHKFSTIARPTVGIRRTSIWGLRVRD